MTLVLTRSRPPCWVRQWPGGFHFNLIWLFLFPAEMQKHAVFLMGEQEKLLLSITRFYKITQGLYLNQTISQCGENNNGNFHKGAKHICTDYEHAV